MRWNVKYLLIIYALGMLSIGFAQERRGQQIPPSAEDTYLFTIYRYNRQPTPPKYMMEGIQKILTTPMTQWTAKDSLFFAYENVHLQKFENALNNFSRLNTDTIKEPHAQILYRVTLQQEKRYQQLLDYNKKTLPDNPGNLYSVKQAFTDITRAYQLDEKDSFDYKFDFVFSVLANDTLEYFDRKAVPIQNQVVQVATAIDSALRQFSILHDKKDLILSKAYGEMADLQREYLYISNAQFFYSAALVYNKSNKAIFKNYNLTKKEMDEKNILPISFRTKFSKIRKNKFNLKDDYIKEVKKKEYSPENYTPPPPEEVRKDYLPWLNLEVVSLIVITIALLFVLFFVKVRKK